MNSSSADIQNIHSSMSNEWFTPAENIEAARTVLGAIDLDPASCELADRTVRATHYFTAQDDGLTQPWYGRVFLNPPYGKVSGKSSQDIWSRKIIDEFHSGRVHAAILLVNACIGDRWFNRLWDYPLCFVDRRIRFDSPNGHKSSPTKGNCFVYFGDHVQHFHTVFSKHGTVVTPGSHAITASDGVGR
jgi:hypothetical protein